MAWRAVNVITRASCVQDLGRAAGIGATRSILAAQSAALSALIVMFACEKGRGGKDVGQIRTDQ